MFLEVHQFYPSVQKNMFTVFPTVWNDLADVHSVPLLPASAKIKSPISSKGLFHYIYGIYLAMSMGLFNIEMGSGVVPESFSTIKV